MPKPVVAAVNGAAAGIGCSFALACDLVVAAESSYFLLAFVNIGLVADGGSSLLIPERVGFARAAEMAMLGERVPAPTGARVGPDQPRRRPTTTLRRRPTRSPTASPTGPTRSYAGTKRQLNAWQFARMAGATGARGDASSRRWRGSRRLHGGRHRVRGEARRRASRVGELTAPRRRRLAPYTPGPRA